MDYLALGKRIQQERKKLGWKQDEFAKSVGISTSFMGHIERGTRTASMHTMVCITNALQISMDKLLGDSLFVNKEDVQNDIHERLLARLLECQLLVQNMQQDHINLECKNTKNGV